MSKGRSPKDSNRRQKQNEPTPEARRKQIIVGVVMGVIMGVLLGALTQFWLWLPAGVAFGLFVGAVMRPPSE